jgi:hypothetical protein
MEIKLLSEYLRVSEGDSLYNFFRPVILRPSVKNDLLKHEVNQSEEMRIDLIFQNIYELTPQEVGLYLDQIDVLLGLNNIDNPINIRRGSIIYYPEEVGDLDRLRIDRDENRDIVKSSVGKKLAVPNKSTRKDNSRSKYNENGFSLPPVVQETPKPPVRIENGNRFSVGGL